MQRGLCAIVQLLVFLYYKPMDLLGTDFKTCCLMKYERRQCSLLNILLCHMLPSECFNLSCVAILSNKGKLIRLKCVQNPRDFVVVKTP